MADSGDETSFGFVEYRTGIDQCGQLVKLGCFVIGRVESSRH